MPLEEALGPEVCGRAVAAEHGFNLQLRHRVAAKTCNLTLDVEFWQDTL